MSTPTVTVLGGGLAGITAALDCARAGTRVTLLESRGRLGGAAYSFSHEGLRVDNGQHVFLRCCTAYRQLLEELGASDLVTMQPRLEVPVVAPGGRQGRLRRSSLPAPLQLAPSLLRYPFLNRRQRLAVAWAMQCLARVDRDDPANDGRSFGEWLRAHGQGSQTIAAIWDLITRPTVNLTVDDASLAQAAQVFQVGLLEDAAAGDIGWASAPLAELHDGCARRALASAGVTVRLHTGGRAIEPTPAGLLVQARERHAAAATASISDAVVLATPPARAAQLLPRQAGLAPEFATRLGSSPIVNLHVVYDRRVLEHPFVAAIGSPVQWVFDRTRSAGLESGQYLAVSLSAAERELAATAQELGERYLPALADLFPAAQSAAVLRFSVTREHAATFRAAPGARRWRPAARTGLPGLFLAGSWTDTGWPATMEGAVRSGHAAAAAVVESLGQVDCIGGGSERGHIRGSAEDLVVTP